MNDCIHLRVIDEETECSMFWRSGTKIHFERENIRRSDGKIILEDVKFIRGSGKDICYEMKRMG